MTLIAALIWFAVITIALIAFEITFTYGTRGFGYGFSSNRAKVDLSAFEGRMKRHPAKPRGKCCPYCAGSGGWRAVGRNRPGGLKSPLC